MCKAERRDVAGSLQVLYHKNAQVSILATQSLLLEPLYATDKIIFSAVRWVADFVG